MNYCDNAKEKGNIQNIYSLHSNEAFPSPGDFPDPGIELVSPAFPALQVDSLPSGLSGKINEVKTTIIMS